MSDLFHPDLHGRTLASMRSARDARRSRVEAYFADPRLQAIKARLDGLERTTSDAIFDALGPWLQDVDWVASLVLDQLRPCRDSDYILPFAMTQAGVGGEQKFTSLNLMVHPLARISLQIACPLHFAWLQRQPDFATVARISGIHTCARFLAPSRGAVTVRDFTPVADDTDLGAIRLEDARRVEIRSGDILRVAGDRQAVTFERMETPIAMLEVADLRNVGAFSVDFEIATRTVRRVNSNSTHEARIPTALWLLRQLGRSDRALVAPVLEHPDFHVRWFALRELAALEGARALADVERFQARERNPLALRGAANLRQHLEASPCP